MRMRCQPSRTFKTKWGVARTANCRCNMNVTRDAAELLSRLNEKDYRDYEVIVAEIQRFQSLSPQDQWVHWKAHLWDALAGVKTPDGGYINLPREARLRFRQGRLVPAGCRWR